MEPTDIIIQAMAATTFAKVLVDVTKLSLDAAAGKVLPVLAIVYGNVVAFLLLLVSSASLTRSTISMAILVGILAGGGAVGVTELQNKAKENE